MMRAPQALSDGIRVSVDQLIAIRDDVESMGLQHAIAGLTDTPGQTPGPKRGAGVDFEELRPYQHGDDVRHIDWNATARLGEPYLKLYREERERLLVIVVDLRASMLFGSKGQLKSVAACELGAALAWLAASHGHRVSAVVTAPGDTDVSRPRSGTQGALAALGVMTRQHARLLDADHNERTNLCDALGIMNHSVAKGGRAILLTGGSEPGPAYDAVAGNLAPTQQLLVTLMRDPLEAVDTTVPPGRYPFHAGPTHGEFIATNRTHTSLSQRREDYCSRAEERFSTSHTPVFIHNTTTPLRNILATLCAHDPL